MKHGPVSRAGREAAPKLAEPAAPARGGRPCPICGKPAREEHRPFCSARCADVDLNRWLGGAYVIPAAPEPDEDAD